MARKKGGSPTVEVVLTTQEYETARQSDSGGCLIADHLKAQGYKSVHVDMATIRITDPATATRYTYLTPEPAQYILLAFDQGWPSPFDQFTLRRAVKITPVTLRKKYMEAREDKLARLEAKVENGEILTKREKASLAHLRKPLVRPETHGPAEVSADGTVTGGRPLKVADNPNLLRGRHRHFGAKLAKPGQVFQNAVDEAVSERLQETLVS